MIEVENRIERMANDYWIIIEKWMIVLFCMIQISNSDDSSNTSFWEERMREMKRRLGEELCKVETKMLVKKMM